MHNESDSAFVIKHSVTVLTKPVVGLRVKTNSVDGLISSLEKTKIKDHYSKRKSTLEKQGQQYAKIILPTEIELSDIV